MGEVEIKIRFITSRDKFPSQQLKWLVDMFDLLKHQGEKIPAMELSTVDRCGITYRTQVR